MADLDYYQTLGVSRHASMDDIRKAYKRLARENHPDRRPDDKAAAERFKRIQQAHDVLSDADKREMYDRYGTAFDGSGRARQQAWSSRSGPVDLNDIFGGQFDLGDLFGGGFGRSGFGRSAATSTSPRRGRDGQAEIEIPFHVAALGGEYQLHLRRAKRDERLTVKVPAGVDSGSVIRLAGQGDSGPNGGPPGDLLVTVTVAPHPYFRRDGRDLLLDVPVTAAEAALGAKIEVPTLSDGMVVVSVPAGTSSGTRLRLRGQGIAHPQSAARGDQLVLVMIVVPERLDVAARRAFEQLAVAAPQSPRDGRW